MNWQILLKEMNFIKSQVGNIKVFFLTGVSYYTAMINVHYCTYKFNTLYTHPEVNYGTLLKLRLKVLALVSIGGLSRLK